MSTLIFIAQTLAFAACMVVGSGVLGRRCPICWIQRKLEVLARKELSRRLTDMAMRLAAEREEALKYSPLYGRGITPPDLRCSPNLASRSCSTASTWRPRSIS